MIVIRYEGRPRTGMREMLAVTAARSSARALGDDIALMTDGRFRRDTWPDGRPRRTGGGARGPDALLFATATIILDVEATASMLDVPAEELSEQRLTAWNQPARYTRGMFTRNTWPRWLSPCER